MPDAWVNNGQRFFPSSISLCEDRSSQLPARPVRAAAPEAPLRRQIPSWERHAVPVRDAFLSPLIARRVN